MKTFRVPLRVVFYQEEGSWIAHCLEFDLCGDGQTKEQALASLSTAVAIQVDDAFEHGNPTNLFSPAPSDVQEMFFAGKHTAIAGELRIVAKSVIFETPEYREYSEDRAESDSGLVRA